MGRIDPSEAEGTSPLSIISQTSKTTSESVSETPRTTTHPPVTELNSSPRGYVNPDDPLTVSEILYQADVDVNVPQRQVLKRHVD